MKILLESKDERLIVLVFNKLFPEKKQWIWDFIKNLQVPERRDFLIFLIARYFRKFAEEFVEVNQFSKDEDSLLLTLNFLSRMGDGEAFEKFCKIFRELDNDAKVKALMYIVNFKVDIKRFLFELLKEDYYLSKGAFEAILNLSSLRDINIELFFETYSPSNKISGIWLLKILGKVKVKDAFKFINHLLNEDFNNFAYFIIGALKYIDNNDRIKILKKIWQRGDWFIKKRIKKVYPDFEEV